MNLHFYDLHVYEQHGDVFHPSVSSQPKGASCPGSALGPALLRRGRSCFSPPWQEGQGVLALFSFAFGALSLWQRLGERSWAALGWEGI